MTSLKPLRAVAYARYSSEQQRAASIDDQLRNSRRQKNHSVVDLDVIADSF